MAPALATRDYDAVTSTTWPSRLQTTSLTSSSELATWFNQAGTRASSMINSSECGTENESIPTDPFDIVRQQHPELVMFSFVFDTIIIGTLCVFGMLGNGVSFLVLRRDRTSAPTSYLLQILAVVQTLLLAGCLLQYSLRSVHMYLDPEPTALLYFYFHNFYLHTVGYLWSLAMFSQTLMNWIILAISIERFLVVRRPLDAPSWCSIQRAKRASAILALVAFAFNIPRWFEWEVFEYYDGCASDEVEGSLYNQTNVSAARDASQQPIFIMSGDGYLRQLPAYNYIYRIGAYFVFVAGGPFILLIILNVLLVKDLQKAAIGRARLAEPISSAATNSRDQPDASNDSKTHKHQHKLKLFSNQSNYTRLVIVVVLTFVVCQAPAFAHQVFTACGMMVHEYSFLVYSSIVSNSLVVANCSLNFLVYCAYSGRFRLLVRRMLEKCRRRRRRAAARAQATPPVPRTPVQGTLTTAPTPRHGTTAPAAIRIELAPSPATATQIRKQNAVLSAEKLLVAYSNDNNSPVFRITMPASTVSTFQLDSRLRHCLRPPAKSASPSSQNSARSTTPLITSSHNSPAARPLLESSNQNNEEQRGTLINQTKL